MVEGLHLHLPGMILLPLIAARHIETWPSFTHKVQLQHGVAL